MSIVLQGSTSGSITLQEPAVAGSTVLSLPATTGTVLTSASPASDLPSSINGPAFSVQATTTQNISNATFTKVTLGTENFDTNNNFASSTFTPTVAGYYQISAAIFYNTSATSGLGQIFIYKNGSSVYASYSNMSSIGYCGLSISGLVYCNGSTDYIDLYTYHTFGTTQPSGSGAAVYMTGALVRSA